MGQADPAKSTIVVVENDEDIRFLIVMALELDPGLHVLEASTALAALRKVGEKPRPDLLLIDNSLPDMDGIQLAEALKEVDVETPIPFAFITASVRERDLNRFKHSGAIGVIAKPFDPLTLAKSVKGLLLS